jgi:hypothetical protein
MRTWAAVDSLAVGLLAVSCVEPGSTDPTLAQVKSQELSETVIVATRLNTLEDAIFNQPPSGWYGVGIDRGHFLFISQSLGSFAGGYGPRAYVTRDDRVVNPEGTELAGQLPPWMPIDQAAVHTGTHWLAFVGRSLSVLGLEGDLVATRELALSGRAIVRGGERTLILGAAPDAGYYGGIQQGQFLNDEGVPLGPVFDIAPGATLLRGGAAYNGAHFVVEYSTPDGVFAVAVSDAGEHGEPVQIATGRGDPNDYGLAMNVLTDGEGFLLTYQRSYDDPTGTPQGPHFRTASVGDSLELIVGEQQIEEGPNPEGMRSAFIGGRYRFLTGAEYAIYAAADGTSPVMLGFSGAAVRLAEDLTDLGEPVLNFGTGPQPLGASGATFDGDHFVIEWNDPARASVRTIDFSTSGASLTEGPVALEGANAATSARFIASNGSSVLRLLVGSSAATLTGSEGTVATVDLSALALGDGYNPSVATDGTDYLVASSNTGVRLARISSEGRYRHAGTRLGARRRERDLRRLPMDPRDQRVRSTHGHPGIG